MDGARYLEDGKLTIFRRAGTYYARLRLSPGKYVTRSLKTTVEETAVQTGRRCCSKWNTEPSRACRQNPNYSRLSSTSTSASVSGIMRTARPQRGCCLVNPTFALEQRRCHPSFARLCRTLHDTKSQLKHALTVDLRTQLHQSARFSAAVG